MKKIIFLFFAFVAMAQSSIAQSDSVQFEITIADSTTIVGTTGGGLPLFSDANVNSIMAYYYITNFNRAYPSSRHKYMRDVYTVRCNSINLATTLNAYNSALFPKWKRTYEKKISSIYTPNDWNLAVSGASDYLDYIKAREAWFITQGDPSVVIGVTDNYLLHSHEDFYNTGGASKIAYLGYNPGFSAPWNYNYSYHHGTAVSSMIAGATDNNLGLPSIGFNCKLDFASTRSFHVEEDMLQMSLKGRRIINCSWYDPDDTNPNLFLRNHFWDQNTYNELYENGTLMCFAATNGWFHSGNPNNYAFPASLDHVFSVSSIGWKNPRGGSYVNNVKGLHDLRTYDDSVTYNHNDRVDLCAPTFLGASRWVPWDPTYKYYDFASGTSSSCPLVAGTAGLIQSALKAKRGPDVNFSPYQLEWLLKVTSNKDFLSFSENAAYSGKLGAGRLDAFLSVTEARNLSPNDEGTQTMYIKGLEINTICAPGFSSNGVLPKLKPIIVNGVEPYTYVWEQVPDGSNTAILDDENIAEPTIVGIKSGASTKTLHYRLTVYDDSRFSTADTTHYAQKVAMKTFKIQLTTEGHDLAMRDSYMDMMEEANMQRINDPRDWDTWTSPDIWNRHYADAGTEHENPEYFDIDPNHMYTRVRNVGCFPSPASARLRLYWTKASAGENWDKDWKYALECGMGALQPVGLEVTSGSGISIPVLQPGAATVIHQEWYPIMPQLYCGEPTTFEVCFLGRIEETTFSPYGMKITEKFYTDATSKGIGENIRNNNNIVTRNTILTNLSPGDHKTMKRQMVIANGNNVARTFNFEFASERSIYRHFAGDFSSLGSVTLHLGDLFDVWVNAGSFGTVASINQTARTVTFDGANTLRLDSLPLAANERFNIEVEFTLDSPVVIEEISNHVFHARQFDVTAPYDVYGAVNFHVNVSPADEGSLRKTLENAVSHSESFQISPNPTNGILYISYGGEKERTTEIVITDITGKKLMTEKANFTTGSKKEINLSRFASGVYLINITNANRTNEIYKVVKE